MIAGSAVILSSPLLLAITLMVIIAMRCNPFYKQIRPGKDGRPFTMWKFKTMNDDRDRHGRLLPDSERITRTGSILRKLSLDELPELYNVLKGDMSIVGPRPLLTKYLNRYTPEQNRRHEVKPGMTGWAQVNGRNAISWEEKFALDIWYVDNLSLYLDLRIILMTFQKIIIQEGISHQGEATMMEFKGSNQENP
jgi:lipopolysaccharide/colanic/teichoic acid biosynthesis glycosyltransferase